MAALSPDVWIMLRPASAWRDLVQRPGDGGLWTGLRRPVLTAAILGCTISLITSSRLTPRLVVPATIYASIVPLCQLLGLAAAIRTKPTARMIDLFCAGNAPWSLWLLYLAAVWAFLSPDRAFATLANFWIWDATALVVAAWTSYIDYCFFRTVLDRTPPAALRDLFVERAIAWTPGLAIFLWSSGWSTLAARLAQ